MELGRIGKIELEEASIMFSKHLPTVLSKLDFRYYPYNSPYTSGRNADRQNQLHLDDAAIAAFFTECFKTSHRAEALILLEKAKDQCYQVLVARLQSLLLPLVHRAIESLASELEWTEQPYWKIAVRTFLTSPSAESLVHLCLRPLGELSSII